MKLPFAPICTSFMEARIADVVDANAVFDLTQQPLAIESPSFAQSAYEAYCSNVAAYLSRPDADTVAACNMPTIAIDASSESS